MEAETRAEPGFFVRISCKGSAAFDWEICRDADSTVVRRAPRLFDTRVDAIVDSARAAASLGIAPSES
jgi:hypothetical protein